MREPKIKNPKVFISYAWTSKEYSDKVYSFVRELGSNYGIEVLFDKFSVSPGQDLNYFMEQSVNDDTVTNVLILLNKHYAEKANNREGGVGKETQIISEEVYNKVSQTKFIPVIFERGENGEVYKPTYLRSAFHIDLTNSETYSDELMRLIKTLYGEQVYQKPEKGNMPAWVVEDSPVPLSSVIKFNEIKNQTNSSIQNIDFKIALDNVKNKILNFDLSNIKNDENYYGSYINKYKEALVLRDEYLQLLTTSLYVQKSIRKIGSFFEEVKNSLYKSSTQYKEILEMLLQECFIYTIAIYYKNDCFKEIGELFGRTYFKVDYSNKPTTYEYFYCSYFNVMDEAICDRDKKNYLSGLAQFWIENIAVKYCTKEEFTFADCLCLNYFIFGKQNDLYRHWFPLSYPYESNGGFGGNLRSFSQHLMSRKFVAEVIYIFNFNSLEEFKNRFKAAVTEIDNREWDGFGYRGSFYRVPFLSDFIKAENIGQYD